MNWKSNEVENPPLIGNPEVPNALRASLPLPSVSSRPLLLIEAPFNVSGPGPVAGIVKGLDEVPVTTIIASVGDAVEMAELLSAPVAIAWTS